MTNIIPHASFEHVRYAVADNVALIELNRPEVRNALNRRAYDEVESAFRHADADQSFSQLLASQADQRFLGRRNRPRREGCAGGVVGNVQRYGHGRDI